MKKKICAFLNLIYSIICFLMFLIQNGDLIIPGTTEVRGASKQFTDRFLEIFEGINIGVALIGIGIVLFDFLVQKELKAVNKVGCMIGLFAGCFTVVCILGVGSIPITCVLGLLACVLILIKKRDA